MIDRRSLDPHHGPVPGMHSLNLLLAALLLLVAHGLQQGLDLLGRHLALLELLGLLLLGLFLLFWRLLVLLLGFLLFLLLFLLLTFLLLFLLLV